MLTRNEHEGGTKLEMPMSGWVAFTRLPLLKKVLSCVSPFPMKILAKAHRGNSRVIYAGIEEEWTVVPPRNDSLCSSSSESIMCTALSPSLVRPVRHLVWYYGRPNSFVEPNLSPQEDSICGHSLVAKISAFETLLVYGRV